MWHEYFHHMLIKPCDSIHVYVDCMQVLGVEQEVFLLQGSMMHALCSVSVISEVSVCHGLTTAGSSAPRSSACPGGMGERIARVNVTKLVG